jgi:putative tricarboxylic transport membrane protein
MRKAGVWMGIILLLLSIATFTISLSYGYYSKYGPGAGLFPLWISGIFIIISLLYIVESIRKEGVSIQEVLPKGKDLNYILKIMVSIALFIIIAPYAGYNVASIVMLFILFYGKYSWYAGLGIAFVTTLILFFVFETYLRIPLPLNSFGW